MLRHKTGLCSCPDWKINGSLLEWYFRCYKCPGYCLTFVVDTQMYDIFSLSIEENDSPQTDTDLFFQRVDQKKFSVLISQHFISVIRKRAHCSGTGTIIAVVRNNNCFICMTTKTYSVTKTFAILN